MKINEVIKERRKALDMTQEQIAVYLGVTAPAVHKWEKGTSLPDVAILPALARVLKIDLNTLFAFEKELTDEEINHICKEITSKIQEEDYKAGFAYAMEKVKEYPNCEKLLYYLAATLDSSLMLFCVEEQEQYREKIDFLYERSAEGEDEKIRYSAIQVLIYKALQKKEFEKAENLWESLPDITIDKKMIKATICENQENYQEAIKILEEKLYSGAAQIQNCLINLMICLEKTEKWEEMEFCAGTLKQVIDVLGLWKYGKHMADYEVAVAKKDREKTLKALRLMLESLEEEYDLLAFPLYQELTPQGSGNSSIKFTVDSLVKKLKAANGLDGEGFLKDDWELKEILSR